MTDFIGRGCRAMADQQKTFTVTAAQMYMLRRCQRLIGHHAMEFAAPEALHTHLEILSQTLRDIEGERVTSGPVEIKECV